MTDFKEFDNPLAVARQAAFYETELHRLNGEIINYQRLLSEAQDAHLQIKKLKTGFYEQLKDQ